MNMYWLMLYMIANTPAMTTIPEKYPDLAQCQKAGISAAPIMFSCVKAVEAMCNQAIPGTNKTIAVPCDLPASTLDLRGQICTADGKNCKSVEYPYPGYYCGQFPDKCKIKE